MRKRGWLSEAAFLDLLGAANLLPGPTSTEVAIGIGRATAGIAGMLASGILFILPAALMVLAIAIAYAGLAAEPAVGWVLAGVAPVAVVVVIRALIGLAPTALRGRTERAVAIVALVAAILGVHPLAILAGSAVAFLALRGVARDALAGVAAIALGAGPGRAGTAGLLASGAAALGVPAVFLLFAGLGCVTFGSGYLLVTFLREALVVPGIVSDRVLLDAIAIGQLTPGPLFTSATFIGYALAGIPGAVAATVGIFLPSFVLVGLVHPMLERVRGSVRLAAALDGVNAASIGLLAAVAAELAGSAVTGVATAAIGLAAAVLVLPGRVGPTIAILGGALAGLAAGAAGLLG